MFIVILSCVSLRYHCFGLDDLLGNQTATINFASVNLTISKAMNKDKELDIRMLTSVQLCDNEINTIYLNDDATKYLQMHMCLSWPKELDRWLG